MNHLTSSPPATLQSPEHACPTAATESQPIEPPALLTYPNPDETRSSWQDCLLTAILIVSLLLASSVTLGTATDRLGNSISSLMRDTMSSHALAADPYF
jgi:hypothetical protein